MTDQLRFRILGCGSSGGVPRLGGNWGACDPNNPKNARTRCSLLVERQSENGRTQVLIDTSPDMRAQLLQAQVGRLDAVLYTHDHADHVHGLDDLRMTEHAQLKFSGVIKFDLESGDRELYEHGEFSYGMEAQFVPRAEASSEDDGWLIMYVH